ncbi:MAG TPA: winged helix DNA-binding domain-containing protein [Gemmatimonadaceae bacterium]|nr:winged helix DNA-binding domain-containing protein [Gemmatimonadaceae bacterium]
MPRSRNATDEICTLRLANQHLLEQTARTASKVVAALGAIQAQDYAGAKWGIAQRTTGVTDTEVERAISRGQILRTHILRPTWHFVSAADIRWMLALTAPRIRKLAAHYDRRLGIDDDVRRRVRLLLAKALRGSRHLTRAELAQALTKGGVRADGTQRLAHLMIHAELDGLICSGARRGKQFTYALLDECVEPSAELRRDEALHRLATRYFTTRGPATEDDFAWWSGLTKADAKEAVSLVDGIENLSLGGRRFWLRSSPQPKVKHTLRLLPVYDEYLVSYADRSAMQTRVNPETVGETFDFLGSYVMVSSGQIVGRWKRAATTNNVVITPQPLTRLTSDERAEIWCEAERFAQYLGLPLQIQKANPKAASPRL